MPTSPATRCTVMLLDDHEMVRQGLALGLNAEADIEVVGSFGAGRELLEALARRPVDVVVMDFVLAPSDIDGLTLLQSLGRHFSQCRALIVSSDCSPATVALALKAGCWGVLGKTQNLTELITAIRSVAQGRLYVQPCMVPTLHGRPSALGAANTQSIVDVSATGLTPKEREVLRCFLDGMSVGSIAAKFSRSASTISTQKQSAYRKLGVRNDSELFKFIQQFGTPG
ncbi:response regulator transcription factor [Pseudomonas orientalis]|uniref:response regulator transcription factor n=1 Tax=Pseudomonas orientalis TaxID=76758 RepID=UPI001F150DBE|nr:response regulator transcription factor [Pseudomonas orientalis]